MPKRHSYEFIFKYFREHGYTLLEPEYWSARDQLLKYSCDSGHEGRMSFSNFKKGHRCPKCHHNIYDLESVKKIFTLESCTLMADKYINNSTRMSYICNCGNAAEITLANFLKGKRCRICGINKTSGENHFKWDPSKTTEDRLRDRGFPEYKKWRTSVFERDDFTCVNCSKRGGKLCAHHISSYANNPTSRTDLNNGATLCWDCHSKFHRKYGKGRNTSGQFREFLAEEVTNRQRHLSAINTSQPSCSASNK